jgi:glycosyltransferase involved in cell wall biosynthesis
VDQSGTTVGFIGRFHHKKNLSLLLEALCKLPHYELVVAGHGDERAVSEIHALADRLGVSGRVTWLGWIGREDRAAFYRRIDVLAMPSVYECYGMVAAEAMANGTPVVVTETTGAAELARASGGGLVTSHDADSFAAALSDLTKDPGVRALAGARAASFAADSLTPTHYGHAMLEVYGRLREHR